MGVVGDKSPQQVIATRTVIVRNPSSGTFQQIREGQRVPNELLEVYEAGEDLTGDETAQVSFVGDGEAGEDGASAASEPDSKREDVKLTAGELQRLNRDALNEVATEEGVENPEQYDPKRELVAAIERARAA